MEKLTRTHYRDANEFGEPPREGSVRRREALVDLEQYTRPLEQAHAAALHTPGIATGLGVRATQNAPDLRVLPGVAITPRGDHIVLAAGGEAKLREPGELTPVTPTGAVVPTTDRDGDHVLTITYDQTFDQTLWISSGGDGNADYQLKHTPWLRLHRAKNFTLTDDQLVLAHVTLVNGKVTGLATGTRRHSTQTITLHRPTSTAGAPQLSVDADTAAELVARPDGSVALTATTLQLPTTLTIGGAELTASTPGALSALSINATRITLGSQGKTTTFDATTGHVGIGTTSPAGRLHVVDTGGFGTETPDGRLERSNTPLLIQASNDSAAAFGILNSDGRPTFAISIEGNKSSSELRGTTTLWECSAGSWNAVIGIGDRDVAIGAHDRANLGVNGTVRTNSLVVGVDVWNTHNPGYGRMTVRDALRIGRANLPSTMASLAIDDSTEDNAWDTAAFRKSSIGPNWSHIHHGSTGDWYIRSSDNEGKVVLQDTGGNVGIGTASPVTTLDVKGEIAIGGRLAISGGNHAPWLQLNPRFQFPSGVYTDKLNIGGESDQGEIARLYIRNGGAYAWGAFIEGDLGVIGLVTQSCSAQFKEDIEMLDETRLRELHDDAMKTPIATFTYRGADMPARRSLGVILEQCPSYLVNGIGISPVEYAAMLHGAFKVLSKRLTELTVRLDRISPPHTTTPANS